MQSPALPNTVRDFCAKSNDKSEWLTLHRVYHKENLRATFATLGIARILRGPIRIAIAKGGDFPAAKPRNAEKGYAKCVLGRVVDGTELEMGADWGSIKARWSV